MPFLLLKTPVAKHWRFNRFSDLAVIKALPSILHGKGLLWHYGKERNVANRSQRTEQWFQINFIPVPPLCLRENFSLPLKTKRSNIFFWFKTCSQLYWSFMRSAQQQDHSLLWILAELFTLRDPAWVWDFCWIFLEALFFSAYSLLSFSCLNFFSLVFSKISATFLGLWKDIE